MDFNKLINGLKQEKQLFFPLGLGEGDNHATEEFQFDVGEYSIMVEAYHNSHYAYTWSKDELDEISRVDDVTITGIINEEGEDVVRTLSVKGLSDLIEVAKGKIIFE
jgi:hypothetical protein